MRALVTGANGGIAPAVIAALGREGWEVAGSDVDHADLADPAAPARIFDELGPFEALVTCHAVSEHGGVLEATADQIDRHLIVNARGTLLLMAELVRRLRGKGAIEWLTVSAAASSGRGESPSTPSSPDLPTRTG